MKSDVTRRTGVSEAGMVNVEWRMWNEESPGSSFSIRKSTFSIRHFTRTVCARVPSPFARHPSPFKSKAAA